MSREAHLVLFVLAMGWIACTDADVSRPGSPSPAEDAGLLDGGSEADVGGSESAFARAELKPMTGSRLIEDLARRLGLPRDRVCVELGRIDCLELHRVSLLEVEPRELRIQRPIEGLVTGVIATDRVALLSCTARVEADRDGEFPPPLVPELAAGTLASADAREAVVGRLAVQLLDREASPTERSALASLYDQLASEDRDGAWATLACFTLATLTERLFY